VLKLTKKADYGLIALRHLAIVSKQHISRDSSSVKEISELYHIPTPLLAKLMQMLVKRGFLQSVQGTNGGYRLAREASTITVLEVIRAIDGPVLLTACFTETQDKGCTQSQTCTVKEPLRRIHESIQNLLENITIAEMAADETGGGNPPPGAGNAQFIQIQPN
jgi:Rrf2 family protein